MGEQCMHVPALHACNRQRGCAHVQRDSRKPCKPRLLGMKPITSASAAADVGAQQISFQPTRLVGYCSHPPAFFRTFFHASFP